MTHFMMDNFKFYVLTRFRLGISATDCLTELQTAHEESSPSRSTLFRWFSEFREEDTNKEETAGASAENVRGRRRSTRTLEMIRNVEELLEDDCKTTVRELADCLEIGKTSVFEILTEDLHLRNVSSVWVPHLLSDANKEARVNCAKSIRTLFYREGIESFCNKLVVEDETWVYLSGQRSKQRNRCWLARDQLRPQIVRRTLADRKVMLLVAFSPCKRFSISAVAPGETVNATSIIDFVRHTGNLWRNLRSNPIHLNEVLWMWDNARPHAARQVKQFMETRQITTVYQSPYSPDFNLCDRFFFNWMKSDFADRTFDSPSELEDAALHWARRLSEECLQQEVKKFIDHCQAVIDNHGDYVTC